MPQSKDPSRTLSIRNPMRLVTIFAIVGTLVTFVIAAIVVSFVIVTTDSVTKVVRSAAASQLDYTRAFCEKFVELAAAAPRALRDPFASAGVDLLSLPPTIQPAGTPQTQLRPFLLAMNLMVQHLRNVDAASYVYMTGRSNWTGATEHWVDFGSGRDAAGGVFIEVPDMTLNSSILNGSAFPIDLVALDIMPRPVTGQPWQLEVAALTVTETTVAGRWSGASVFFDNVLRRAFLLLTYMMPMRFTPAGACILAVNIDVNLDAIRTFLRTLAGSTSRMFLIDARRTLLYSGAVMLATSLADSELPLFNATSNAPFPFDQTPNGDVNALMRRVADALGGDAAMLTARNDVILENFAGSVLAITHVWAQGGLHFVAVLQTPRSVFFGDAERTQAGTIAGGVVAVAFSVLVFTLVIVALIRPIAAMLLSMQHIAVLDDAAIEGDEPFLDELRPIHTELIRLNLAVQSFARYVPRDVVKSMLLTSSLGAGSLEATTATVVNANLVGFNLLCEQLSTDALSELLQSYFTALATHITYHCGSVQSYVGDTVTAVWGAPLSVPKMEALAVIAALRMAHETTTGTLGAALRAHNGTGTGTGVSALDALEHPTASGTDGSPANARPSVRIGVAGGEVLAGNMGSSLRMSYSVLGDVVVYASRLESFNRRIGTNILVTEPIARAAALEGNVAFRLLGRVAIVGRDAALAVYEPMGVTDAPGGVALGEAASDISHAFHDSLASTPLSTGTATTAVLTGPGADTRSSGESPGADAHAASRSSDFARESPAEMAFMASGASGDFGGNVAANHPAPRLGESAMSPGVSSVSVSAAAATTAAATAATTSAPAAASRFARHRRSRRTPQSSDVAAAAAAASAPTPPESPGAEDRSTQGVFGSVERVTARFADVMRAALRHVPATEGRAAYARRFSAAARAFIAQDFSTCVTVLDQLAAEVDVLCGGRAALDMGMAGAIPMMYRNATGGAFDDDDSVTGAPIPRCPWTEALAAAGGPARSDRAWCVLRDLSEDALRQPRRELQQRVAGLIGYATG